MKIRVQPGKRLDGEAHLPGDKSISHRAAILAALAEGTSRIENFLVAGVTRSMLEAVKACGLQWAFEGTTLTMQGRGMHGFRSPRSLINCGNSATTIRFLAGVMVAAGISATLDGSESLRRRPMNRILFPLEAMGAVIHSNNGHAPLSIEPAEEPLKAIKHDLPVASAQVKSCLLLAGLGADGMTHLSEPGPSRDHTERMLRNLGVPVEQEIKVSSDGVSRYITRMKGSNTIQLPPFEMILPGDISAAAFLIVAALITPGSRLTLRKVLLNSTRTGLLDALTRMGASIRIGERQEQGGELVGDLFVAYSRLTGTEVSGSLVVRMIDEFPAFAVACAFAEGRSVVRDAQELRMKESDRIAALCAELRVLGCKAVETPDGFIIPGDGIPSGGCARAHGDHRLAMALALVGLASEYPVEVDEAELIQESFPDFVGTLQALGGELERIENA